MKAAVAMWKYPRMIVMVAVVAAIYASAEIVLNPFAIALIPGVIMFRISNIFTMFLAILFGPAGAFGVAFGNIIGDYFTGGVGVGSFFGFLSTLAVGYVGYTFWMWFQGPPGNRVRRVAVYLLTGLVAAAVTGVVLAWGLELLGVAPFGLTSTLLLVNFGLGNWCGGILYLLVYDRFKALGLTWADMMDPSDLGVGRFARAGAILMAIGGFGGWLAGTYLMWGFAAKSFFFALILVAALLL
jgi:energy-coupling factor transport system substrate-specific component